MSALNIIFLIVSVIIIILSLLQPTKTDGASGAIMGGGMNLFSNVKERGSEAFLSKTTMVVAVVFIILAIFVNMYK